MDRVKPSRIKRDRIAKIVKRVLTVIYSFLFLLTKEAITHGHIRNTKRTSKTIKKPDSPSVLLVNWASQNA